MRYDKPIRHGDVLLLPVAFHPLVAIEHQELTIALGEATGHHHTLYPAMPGYRVKEFYIGNRRFIDIGADYFLRHQEHKEIKIPPGTYEITIEKEYDPFEKAMKQVVD